MTNGSPDKEKVRWRELRDRDRATKAKRKADQKRNLEAEKRLQLQAFEATQRARPEPDST